MDVWVVKQYTLASSARRFIEQSVARCAPAASPTGSSLLNSPLTGVGGTSYFQTPLVGGSAATAPRVVALATVQSAISHQILSRALIVPPDVSPQPVSTQVQAGTAVRPSRGVLGSAGARADR